MPPAEGIPAPWTYTDDGYREYTRTTWNATAPEWKRMMRFLEPYGFDLINKADAKVRERFLDLATGAGEPALSLARLVGPEGRVTGVDLSEKMVEIASGVVRERRLKNVEFKVMDAEHLAFPDASFDAVVSRFGFQIFTNPEAVAKEAYRVLRPGGRLVVSVWSTADRAEALHVLIGPMLEYSEPDETGYIPTPYELGGPSEMTTLLEKVGFREAKEDRRIHSFVASDADEYFDMMMLGTPMGHSIHEEEPAVQQKILAKARSNLEAYRTRRGYEIPCECVLVSAVK